MIRYAPLVLAAVLLAFAVACMAANATPPPRHATPARTSPRSAFFRCVYQHQCAGSLRTAHKL